MARLLYLDFLRMVSPGENLDPSLFDFYVFGNFDAIKIVQDYRDDDTPCGVSDYINTFQELHATSKQRRLDVPTYFDKQPMHLYSPVDSAGKIFQTKGKYAEQPLVLTLIQLDDFLINSDTPDNLVRDMGERLKDLMINSGLSNIEYEVFYCLGESDIAIAFRGSSLSDIGRLIYRIRLLEPISGGNDEPQEGLCVLSISSHFAFPKAELVTEQADAFSKWINYEPDLRLISLFDSAFGTDNNAIKTSGELKESFCFDRILLGEWDYIYEWQHTDLAQRFSRQVFKPITAFDPDHTGFFRTSYTVPVIRLVDKDLPYAKSGRKRGTIQDEELLLEYTKEGNAFATLINTIESLSDIYGSSEAVKSLSAVVASMQSTLIGILKHLYQLRDGRFQYDLYSFVIPAFDALPHITNNMASLIRRTMDNCSGSSLKPDLRECRDQKISYLLDGYVHDTSRLLSELQHLFSVLSISPHTYLESYGSNMRSITATCKLLVAYQGIAYSISKHFNMGVLMDDGSVSQVNEVMLVIPYRRIRQSTRVLYEDTSPENRIVYIRINASDMFSIQKTLFMLLHECGHHILNRDFREQRTRCFFDAYTGYLLDQVFSKIYSKPYTSIQTPLVSERQFLDAGEAVNIISIEALAEEKFGEIIFDAIRKENVLGKQILEYWNREYRVKDSVKNIEESVSLNNHFLFHVKGAACSYMEDRLAELKDKSTDSYCDTNALSRHFRDVYTKIVFPLFDGILSKEYENQLHENGNTLWNLAELSAIYRSYSPQRVEKYVHRTCEDAVAATFEDIAEELKMIFSDIYSDVFAFSMLRINELQEDDRREEVKKYLALLRDEAGFQVKTEFKHRYLLARIIAVLQVFFGLSPREVDLLVSSALLLPDKDIKEITEELNKTRSRIGFIEVLKYTKDLCIPKVEEQIKTSDELRQDSERLFKMYSGASEGEELTQVIDQVHYYWRASTQRNRKEQ